MDKGVTRALTVAGGLLTLLCVIFFSIGVFFRPRTFLNHRDVVAAIVQSHGYTMVTYSASLKWPEGVNYYAYGSGIYPYSPTIHIRLADSREIDGMIECQNDKYNCRLTLTDLGIERELMPDIQREQQYSGPPWLRSLLQKIGVTL